MVQTLPLIVIVFILICMIADNPRTPPKKKTKEERWDEFQYNLSITLGGFILAMGIFFIIILFKFI